MDFELLRLHIKQHINRLDSRLDELIVSETIPRKKILRTFRESPRLVTTEWAAVPRGHEKIRLLRKMILKIIMVFNRMNRNSNVISYRKLTNSMAINILSSNSSIRYACTAVFPESEKSLSTTRSRRNLFLTKSRPSLEVYTNDPWSLKISQFLSKPFRPIFGTRPQSALPTNLVTGFWRLCFP